MLGLYWHLVAYPQDREQASAYNTEMDTYPLGGRDICVRPVAASR